MLHVLNQTMKSLNNRKANQLFPNIFAGLISGIINVIYSVSYAILIFSGDLSNDLSIGLSCALMSATLSALIFAVSSSLPFIIAGPDSNSSAILALIAASITAYFAAHETSAELLPTVLVAIVLSTILTGLFLFTVGYLKLGSFIRFIPYPVVGGFLAGVGWLLVQGAFAVMLPEKLTSGELLSLFQPAQLIYWIPGTLLAFILQVLTRRYKHFLIMPSAVLFTALFCHVLYKLIGLSLPTAKSQGLMFENFISHEPWYLWQHINLTKIDWFALSSQGGSLITLVVVVAITILLCATGIELATQSDVDLDKELQVGGINNIVTGFCGGMIGYLSISRSLLNYQAGARRRIAGFVTVGVCLSFLIFGVSFLSYVPKAAFGGLLLYLGISLLVEWVYDAWFRLSRLDYVLVFVILVIVANFGFLSGVGVGVVIACILFVFNYSHLRVIKSSLSGNSYQSNFERSFHQKRLLKSKGDELYILLLQGYIFFGTANNLLSHVRDQLTRPIGDTVADNGKAQPGPKVQMLLLDFRLVGGIDSSALVSFVKMKQLINRLNVKLIFTGLTSDIETQLTQQGVIDRQQEESNCQVFLDLDRGVEWCENEILRAGTFRRKRFMPIAIQLEEFFPMPECVNQFLGYLEKVRAESGDMLYHQGEPSDCIYFVESGQVSIVRELADGKTERMGTVGEGTVLGEIGFYMNTARSASVFANKSSRLYRLTRETLQRMQEDDPKVASACHQFIAQLLAERVMQANRKTQMLLQ